MSRSWKYSFALASAGALLAAAVAALVPLSVAGAGVGGTVITVDTTEDEFNDDGDCSLREALDSANDDAARDGCEGGTGADTVMIPAGTYVLSLPDGPGGSDEELDLDVLDEVTLQGAGASTTIIDADGIDRVLSAQANLHVEGLTITGGVTGDFGRGGGIDFAGTVLTIENSVVTDNETFGDGGGIAFQARRQLRNFRGDPSIPGELHIVDSTISGNTSGDEGGGVYVNGDEHIVTILRSTVSGNEAAGGGGVHIDDQVDLSIDRSTISGNTATGETFEDNGPPGIRRQAQEICSRGGGGLNQEESTGDGDIAGSTSIVNSTISDNTSVLCPGGGVFAGVDSTLANVTVFANTAPSGGNIYFDNQDEGEGITPGVLTLANTIVANAVSGGDCVTELADPASTGGNIDSDGSCGAEQRSDPQLGDLADNGGPTLTHLPLAGSPAIDSAVDATCQTADQRGIVRTQDGDGDGTSTCDVGAVEVVHSTTPTTEGPDDDVDADTAGPAAPATPTVARPTFTG